MSFREKTAWVTLVSMAGIYGIYFWSVAEHRRTGALAFGGLLGTVIALVVVEVVLIVIIAIFAPKDAKAPRDERDRLIELRSTRIAYAGLASSVALACFFGAFTPPIVFNANALLFLIVAAEILRFACQIVQYRRGA